MHWQAIKMLKWGSFYSGFNLICRFRTFGSNLVSLVISTFDLMLIKITMLIFAGDGNGFEERLFYNKTYWNGWIFCGKRVRKSHIQMWIGPPSRMEKTFSKKFPLLQIGKNVFTRHFFQFWEFWSAQLNVYVRSVSLSLKIYTGVKVNNNKQFQSWWDFSHGYISLGSMS